MKGDYMLCVLALPECNNNCGRVLTQVCYYYLDQVEHALNTTIRLTHS